METLTGRTLGPYQLEEHIGADAMGQIYRAVHTKVPVPRRLRTLDHGLAAEEAVVQAVERAGRLDAELRHPNISAVRDVGNQDGVCFIVGDLLADETLIDLIRRETPLPIRRAFPLLDQLAGALDYAHERGVTHGDLHASSVMVDESDRPLLAELGLAVAVRQALRRLGRRHDPAPNPDLAPEASLGADAGPDVDQYGLGIIACRLLSGPETFADEATGPNESDLQPQQPPTSPWPIDPALPEPVRRVLLRQLARLPTARYVSGRQFVKILTRASGLGWFPPPDSDLGRAKAALERGDLDEAERLARAWLAPAGTAPAPPVDPPPRPAEPAPQSAQVPSGSWLERAFAGWRARRRRSKPESEATRVSPHPPATGLTPPPVELMFAHELLGLVEQQRRWRAAAPRVNELLAAGDWRSALTALNDLRDLDEPELVTLADRALALAPSAKAALEFAVSLAAEREHHPDDGTLPAPDPA